jgi:ABC-2 type transport system permease protein
MIASDARDAKPMRGGDGLLRYRAWTGKSLGPWQGVWAIARSGLKLLVRRKLFWFLYALSLMIFLFFFYGQYLQVWLEQKVGDESLRAGGLFSRRMNPEVMLKSLRTILQLNGSADTYANFIWFEGYIVMVVLAMIGSVLIGNDFQFRSLPFYLSKPINRWHYIAGKALAVAVFVNMLTTIPALVLYLEYGFVDNNHVYPWEYYFSNLDLFFGILAYGVILTVTMSLLLLATASWVRRTVPLVMLWVTIFILGRFISRWLVDGLKLTERWRLMDIWNDMYLVGHWVFGTPKDQLRPTWQIQPNYHEALIVIIGVCIFSALYLHRRIRAVEVVT